MESKLKEQINLSEFKISVDQMEECDSFDQVVQKSSEKKAQKKEDEDQDLLVVDVPSYRRRIKGINFMKKNKKMAKKIKPMS